jgi:hypothetical protein
MQMQLSKWECNCVAIVENIILDVKQRPHEEVYQKTSVEVSRKQQDVTSLL